MPKKIKRKSYAVLKRKLDKTFSTYFRLSNAGSGGLCVCYTCGAKKHWKELQTGHYNERHHLNTRWDEENCRIQCFMCNCILHGNYKVFTRKLTKELGEDGLTALELRGALRIKLSSSDLEEKIRHYQELIDNITHNE